MSQTLEGTKVGSIQKLAGHFVGLVGFVDGEIFECQHEHETRLQAVRCGENTVEEYCRLKGLPAPLWEEAH